MLPTNRASPLNTAVIAWLPTPRLVVETPAVPPTNVPEPKLTPLSLKSTVPVGLPTPVTTETVAVKVTLLPKTDGFRLLMTAVDVVPWLTTWLTAPVLPVKAASPL